jgi:uncharacterized protein YndB with AHSA1/START domain
MTDTKPTLGEVGCARYELEVVIDAPRERVWKALTAQIQDWWLPAFHMVGEGSTITFDARAGGHILERIEGGASLLWGTVQMVIPGESIHLVGFSQPEWGGPATTMLRFGLEDRDGGTAVTLRDAIHGRIDEDNLASLQEGWSELLAKGLKRFVETGAIPPLIV